MNCQFNLKTCWYSRLEKRNTNSSQLRRILKQCVSPVFLEFVSSLNVNLKVMTAMTAIRTEWALLRRNHFTFIGCVSLAVFQVFVTTATFSTKKSSRYHFRREILALPSCKPESYCQGYYTQVIHNFSFLLFLSRVRMNTRKQWQEVTVIFFSKSKDDHINVLRHSLNTKQEAIIHVRKCQAEDEECSIFQLRKYSFGLLTRRLQRNILEAPPHKYWNRFHRIVFFPWTLKMWVLRLAR
jgi:hypothetical protein